MTDEYKFKQKDINALSAVGLSLVANYITWYVSPIHSLATLLNQEDKLIFFFLWFTLVGAGLCLIFLNRMFKHGGGYHHSW